MGWPLGWTSLEGTPTPHPGWDTEPDIPRVIKGIPHRVPRLKALGNGQVPQCAALAFTLLEKPFF